MSPLAFLVVLYISPLVPMAERDEVLGLLADLRTDCRRSEAIDTLREQGERVVPHLIVLLSHPSPRVRSSAAEAVGWIGEEAFSAVSHVARALDDKVIEVRRAAARSLRRVGAKAQVAVPQLIEALEDSDKLVVINAAAALAQMKIRRVDAIMILVKHLSNPDDEVQRRAAEALGHVGKSATAKLLAAMENDDQTTRSMAALVLSRIDPKDVRAVPGLIGIVSSREGYRLLVRYEAAYALGEIGPAAKEVVPALTAALNDPGLLSFAAAKCLGEIGLEARASVPALIKLIENHDRGTDFAFNSKDAAIEALGKIGPSASDAVPQIVSALRNAVKHRPIRFTCYRSWIEYTAEDALVGIGRAALPALVQATKSEDRLVAILCAAALGRIHREDTHWLPVLLESLKSDDETVASEAARALGNVGPDACEAVSALIKALDDSRVSVQLAGARALGKIGPRAMPAIPALEKLLKSPWTEGTAAVSLRRIRGDRRPPNDS